MLDVEILVGPASFSPTVLIIQSPPMRSLVKVTYVRTKFSQNKSCVLLWKVSLEGKICIMGKGKG